ncbi:MAG: DUF4340 domain-containing protein [Gammaproteobacteria bacterium]|nr:DUF4340 domain-containing protein [Gammaproteobacteria bacterium]
MKNKGLMILGGFIVVLLVVAISVSNRQEDKVEDVVGGKIFLAELQDKLNDINQLEIKTGDATTTIVKEADTWRVKERNNYRADFVQVKKLLLQLSDLKTIEPKTKKPENYEKIGVQEPTSGSSNKLVTISDANQKAIVKVILGSANKNGTYVRRPSEDQAWLVDGRIDTPADLISWLDKFVANINASEIQSFTLATSKKEKISAAKSKPDDADFVVADLPKGKELKSASAVNTLAANFRDFKFTNVKPSDTADLAKAEKSSFEYALFDGVKIKGELFKLEDKDYVILQALTDVDTAKPRAEELNALWQGWVYEIPTHKADSFRKKLSELLK